MGDATPASPREARGQGKRGVPPSTPSTGTVRLFAFKESLETPFGAPRENGRVVGQLVREGQPAEPVQVSRALYDRLVDLVRKGAVAFPADETGRRRRNRLREHLALWGVPTSVPVRGPGASEAHVLQLEGEFTVHVADGSPDRTASARRLVREVKRQRFLGQD